MNSDFNITRFITQTLIISLILILSLALQSLLFSQSNQLNQVQIWLCTFYWISLKKMRLSVKIFACVILTGYLSTYSLANESLIFFLLIGVLYIAHIYLTNSPPQTYLSFGVQVLSCSLFFQIGLFVFNLSLKKTHLFSLHHYLLTPILTGLIAVFLFPLLKRLNPILLQRDVTLEIFS